MALSNLEILRGGIQICLRKLEIFLETFYLLALGRDDFHHVNDELLTL